jgi:excisionase family DNA binding protein
MNDRNIGNPRIEPRPTKVMTVRELSAYLRVHPSTLYRLLKRNQVPAFRIGSDWRFNIEAIDRWRSQMELSAHVLEKERN